MTPVTQHPSYSFFPIRTTYETLTWKKVARVAWDIFSVIVFPIGLARLGLHWLKNKIRPFYLNILLPARHLNIDNKLTEFLADKRVIKETINNHCQMEEVTVPTKDGATLNVLTFKHVKAKPDSPTVIYFNPNAALTSHCPFESIFAALNQQNTPFNFVAFDYRSTGKSRGVLNGFDDLVTDGQAVVQHVHEIMGAPKDKILFYGYSIGAAVATAVKSSDPELSGAFCNERSLASSASLVSAILTEKITTSGRDSRSCITRALSCAPRFVAFLANSFAYLLGFSFNIMPSFERLKGKNLVIYHANDQVLPYASSVAYALKSSKLANHKIFELVERPHLNQDDHHCHPLNLYHNDPLKEIANFLLPQS